MEPGGSGRVWAVVFECCSREKKTASVLPGLMEIFHLLYQSSSSARCLWRKGEISKNLVSYPFPAWGAPDLRFLNIIKNLRGHGRRRGGIEIILVQEIIFDDPVNQIISGVSNIIFLELIFQGACNHLGFVRVRVCDPALAIKGVYWGLLLSRFLRHFPEGIRRRGRELEVRPPRSCFERLFDLPVYPVLNVVQHSLVARISRELPGFPGSVPLDHELSDFIRNVVGIPTPNRLGRECVC
ncbi:hypothetical protein TNCV_2418141 [Trichonephila clavipes]|nr:hypothetical protein TNCV_2418141 [Trichonephila clavipes]